MVIKRTETLEIPRVSEVRCDFLFWALGEDKPRLRDEQAVRAEETPLIG